MLQAEFEHAIHQKYLQVQKHECCEKMDLYHTYDFALRRPRIKIYNYI